MEAKDPDENHELCYFWCGYIKGFLSYALPSLSNYVATKLRKDEFNRVKIPQFMKVTEVVHDKCLSNNCDIFSITLESEYFRGVRRYLMYANGSFKDKNYCDTGSYCSAALTSIRDELGTSEYEKALDLLSKEDKLTITEIYNEKNSYVADEATVTKWLNSMNIFVDNILNREQS